MVGRRANEFHAIGSVRFVVSVAGAIICQVSVTEPPGCSRWFSPKSRTVRNPVALGSGPAANADSGQVSSGGGRRLALQKLWLPKRAVE